MKPLLVAAGRGLDGIEQVLATARRRGVEVAWIGMPYGAHLRGRARLFCDHAATAETDADVTRVLRAWGPSRVVDILCGEQVVQTCLDGARPLMDLGLPASVVRDLERRAELSNKYATRLMLSAAGVPVPPGLDAAEATAAEAIEQLGTPLVVKGYLGSSGETVRVTSDVTEAQRVADVLVARSGAYYEKFVAGHESAYVATHLDGQIIQEGSYSSIKSEKNKLGFPGRVVPEDRPDLREVGRQVVKAIGGRGLVNVDIITSPDGAIWALDVNPRPWHTTVAMRSTGIDFVLGYLYALGVGPDPGGPRMIPTGSTVDGYPREAAELIRRHPGQGIRMLVRQSRVWGHWAGPGYVAASVFRAGMTLGARLYRDLMAEGPPGLTARLPRLGEYADELGVATPEAD